MRRLIVGGLMVAMLLFALWAERRDSEPDPGVTMLMIFLGVAFLSLFLVRAADDIDYAKASRPEAEAPIEKLNGKV